MELETFKQQVQKIQADFVKEQGLTSWGPFVQLLETRYPGGSPYEESEFFKYRYSAQRELLPWPGLLDYAIVGSKEASCWGDRSSCGCQAGLSSPLSMPQLDTLLSSVCPQITYLQYKKVCSLMESVSYSDHEYYGNSTEYRGWYLDSERLFHMLVGLALI